MNTNKKITNKILLFDDHAEIVLLDRYNNEVGSALIDIDDIDRCKKYKWRAFHTKLKIPYSVATINGKQVLLHQFIMGNYDRGLCIDHINRNPLDNRKQNLRIVTHSENMLNRECCINDDAGVMFYHNKWRVDLKRNNNRYYLGSYDTKEEAIVVRRNFLLDYNKKNSARYGD